MDAQSSEQLVTERLPLMSRLDHTSMRVAELIAGNFDNADMARSLGVAPAKVTEWTNSLLAQLQIGTSIPIYEQRAVITKLVQAHKSGTNGSTHDPPPAQEAKRPTAEQKRALGELGVDIVQLMSALGDAPEKQKQLVACIVSGHSEVVAAEQIQCTVDVVRQMTKLLDTRFDIAARLAEPSARRDFVKAIGLWAFEHFEESIRLFTAVLEGERKIDQPATDMPSEEVLGRYGRILAGLSEGHRELARCYADGLDPVAELRISAGNVTLRRSKISTEFGLPKNQKIPELRTRIIAEAYRRMPKPETPEAALVKANGAAHPNDVAPAQEEALLDLSNNPAAMLRDGANIIDVTDDIVSSSESQDRIARRKAEGFFPEAYVIVPGTDDRYIVFVKRG